MVRVPTHRAPTRPGEMLLEEFLNPMGLTQRKLADAVHLPYQRVHELVNGRRAMTPRTALRLARFFGVSADFWMSLQLRYDLYQAQQDESSQLKRIRPWKAAAGPAREHTSRPTLDESDGALERPQKQAKAAGVRRSDDTEAIAGVRKRN